MKKLIVANWKMNPQTVKEGLAIYKGTFSYMKNLKNVTAIVAAPYLFLSTFSKIKSTKLFLSAQDVSSQDGGAYTGQVSAKMLSNIKITYSIVGHSEVRAHGDTNDVVNKKLQRSIKSKLVPIFCIGESVRDTHGEYLVYIKQQLHEGLSGVSKMNVKNILIAYEPIWAIGVSATREATPEEFTEIQIFIRKVLSDMYDIKTAQSIPVLYGGSVHPKNAKVFLDAGADGLLVGRDSLSIKKFGLILMAAQ